MDDRFRLESARSQSGGCVLAQGGPDTSELPSDLVEASLSSKEWMMDTCPTISTPPSGEGMHCFFTVFALSGPCLAKEQNSILK